MYAKFVDYQIESHILNFSSIWATKKTIDFTGPKSFLPDMFVGPAVFTASGSSSSHNTAFYTYNREN